jgi:hypothetical protein
MKFIFSLLLFSLSSTYGQPKFYNIKIDLIDGKTTSLELYKDKRIVFVVLDPSGAEEKLLVFLDSIQRARTNMATIVLPAFDLNSKISTAGLLRYKEKLGLTVDFSNPVTVLKSAGTSQDKLFKWLMDDKENGHFNFEGVESGQIYVVDEKARLFAVLSRNAPFDVIVDVLNTKIVD